MYAWFEFPDNGCEGLDTQSLGHAGPYARLLGLAGRQCDGGLSLALVLHHAIGYHNTAAARRIMI